MRTFGRILLLIVAIIFFATGIPSLIQSINALNAISWNLFKDATSRSYFAALISSSISCFCGLTALFAAIRGSGSFWLTLISLIMLASIVWYFVEANNAGTLGDWKNILRIGLGFVTPVMFILGSIMVRIRK